MCYVMWLHCFGAEGGQKAVGMCSEKSCLQDHESICNVCFNAFQTVMGQNYSSNRIYIWTMMQFYCKDPEFVQIICFEIALQESYWPLASDLTCKWKGRDAHRKIDPLKRMCKTWLLKLIRVILTVLNRCVNIGYWPHATQYYGNVVWAAREVFPDNFVLLNISGLGCKPIGFQLPSSCYRTPVLQHMALSLYSTLRDTCMGKNYLASCPEHHTLHYN